jgi:2-(1,2-epoxy-1,2-dihydrophenyl)acetyl-CoA isomerase
MFEKILVEKSGDVAIVSLNDPKTLNAVTAQMLTELGSALREIAASSRALLLKGAGRGFCSGANLNGDLSLNDEQGLPDAGASLEIYVHPVMNQLKRLPIPWVTAVRGPAAGVGCSLALAADLVIAGESAYFSQAFSKIALVPDGGSAWLLSQAVGRVRAMELMLLGERLPAPKALEWGLVNRVVADEALDSTAVQLATALAVGPTRTYALIREQAWAAADESWEQSLATERRFQREAGRTADHQEGIAAFRDKRSARFSGR